MLGLADLHLRQGKPDVAEPDCRRALAVCEKTLGPGHSDIASCLDTLGEIVRAADSHPSKPHPAGEGLRWVAFGFSALGLSDAEILQREFIVYYALYAECRRRAAGAGGV